MTEQKRVAEIKMKGSWNWRILAELWLKLEDAGFTTYLNWLDGTFEIEMNENKMMKSPIQIREALLILKQKEEAKPLKIKVRKK